MKKFGKYDGFVYHNNVENEATCGIYKSAIITGSTSWLIPLRKPEEPKHRHQTRYCFSPSPSKEDVDDYTTSKKGCSSPELNTLKEDGNVFRFCGQRPPPDSLEGSQNESSSSDHNSYSNDNDSENFVAYPNFPDSIFNEFFPWEQDVNQVDYDNLMVPYELDESSSVETTKSKRSIGPGANVLSVEKVKAIESPVITIHDKPDLGKLFICILEDTTSVSAPKGLVWDDGEDEPKECEPECNNLFMHTQLNITNCFRYGLAFQIQNMNSRKPNFCSYEGKEGVTNLNSTGGNTVGSEKLHSNRDGKTSPLHPTRELKSYNKIFRLLQQKLEFDVLESLTRSNNSDNNRVQLQLKSQFTTKNSLRQSLTGRVDEVAEDGDINEAKQNESKDSLNVWEQSLLNAMFDILMKKCDQQWLPRDFLKLLNKLSMFFAQEVELRRRGRLEKIARKQMESKMNNNSKSIATNNTTESRSSSNNDTLGTGEIPKPKLRMTMPPNVKDNLHATEVKTSSLIPLWKEVDMLQDCLDEVNKSGEPLDLSAEMGEPNVVKYYQRSWKGVGERRTFDGPARFPLINYIATLDEMLSKQLDPVLEFLWQTYSLVYASCISNDSFNYQRLAKFSAGFEKFFLRPVITFWKTMDPDLLLQYKESIYNHLFAGYNYTLMVHNVKACAQAVYLQENVELLPKSGIVGFTEEKL
ncbi:unnamed protein product [Orchesella dallaii]|uniref:Uncharacterized protein n=1 Tax=Orchesella dallaii TaxID=48710 RepID=A0ABP1QQC3_9HEXA